MPAPKNPGEISPKIDPTWAAALADEFRAPYFAELKKFLQTEIESGQKIFPPGGEIFAAFDRTPLPRVKVVILGQDPYHSPGQAHGLSFSVKNGVQNPPSLQNIFKELAAEFPDFSPPKNGDLTPWADRGVLLLNATLTVRAGAPTSHAGRGWEKFTDAAIRAVSAGPEPVVFLLWGAFARSKKPLIDPQKHAILEAPHPSPLSAHRGFLGCGHFKMANEFLEKWGRGAVDWRI